MVHITNVQPRAGEWAIVQVEQPILNPAKLRNIKFYALAEVPVTSTSVNIQVPYSPLLVSFAQTAHRILNFAVLMYSSKQINGFMFPQRIAPSTTNRVVLLSARRFSAMPTSAREARSAKLSIRALAISPAPQIGNPICVFNTVNTTEPYNRVGELHVANVTGMKGTYDDSTTADNTITVGFSTTGTSGSFSADGNVTLSNSIGSGGGITRDAGYHMYVQGHIYYSYGFYSGTCTTYYLLQATSSVGDVTDGTTEAPTNPYGSCGADGNGEAAVAHNGYWDSDRSQSKTYGGILSWYGFSFGGSQGYTSTVNEGWTNNSNTVDTYVCGDVSPVANSTIFWNDGA